TAPLRRIDEDGLRQVQLAGEALQLLLGEAARVREHREAVPGQRRVGEDLRHDVPKGAHRRETMLRPVRLVIVRHAEAASGEPDELRPLTPEGRDAARALGRRLAAEGIAPAAVVTSPVLRARETAQELARPAGLEPEPDERLAPGATPEAVRAAAE